MHHLMHLHPSPAAGAAGGVVVALSLAAVAVAGRVRRAESSCCPGGMAFLCQCDPATATTTAATTVATGGEVAA